MEILGKFENLLENFVINKDFSIIVYPERALEEYAVDEPHIIISINSNEYLSSNINYNFTCLDKLFLTFSDLDPDITPQIYNMPNLKEKLFKDQHAIQIIEFINKYLGKINLIIISCEAGISRSPAIAAAISKILGLKYKIYFDKYLPNKYVYTKLLDVFLNNYGYTEE